MSTENTPYRQTFIRCRDALSHLTDTQFAVLLGCGKNVRINVAKKLIAADKPAARGVPMVEALAAQLLVLLDREGFDLERFQFDEKGVLIKTPRKGDPEAPDLPRLSTWSNKVKSTEKSHK